MSLDVAGRVKFLDGSIRRYFFTLGFVKIIFLFQLIGDCLAATEQKCLIQTLPLLIDIDSHYMDMVAVDVLMLINYEWLVTESQFVKVLTGQNLEILVCESVFGMRVQRYVKNRLLGSAHLRHKTFEVLYHLGNSRMTVRWNHNLIRTKDTPSCLVYFFAVIGKCSVKR